MAPDTPKTVKFEILSSVDSSISGPRLGRLALTGRKAMETPNFLAVSSRGVVPHITPDTLLNSTQIGGVHMAIEDFIEKATNGTPPIMNCLGSSPLHTFTGLPQSLITLLAPRRTPAVLAPVGNSNSAVSVYTSNGFQVLSNRAYIDYIQKLRPDIAIGLADVPYGTTPGTKRLGKMGDRSLKWLSDLLKEKSKEQAIFAPILPIDLQSQWEYLDYVADEMVDEICGLAFYDSNLLPDIAATTAVSVLPRLSLDEPASPHHILRQLALGMDIFTIPFIGFATDAGIALSFRFPGPSSEEAGEDSDLGSRILPLGIDMWASEHATSVKPVFASCSCYSCTSHHRAFIQHLLSAKEMLGWVLIQIHNHQIMSDFFLSVQKSIKKGSFEHDSLTFNRTYESELPEKSGQGPRVRGYHFKSEGPGEQKKNTAAWGNLGDGFPDVNGESIPGEAPTDLEDKMFAEKTD